MNRLISSILAIVTLLCPTSLQAEKLSALAELARDLKNGTSAKFPDFIRIYSVDNTDFKVYLLTGDIFDFIDGKNTKARHPVGGVIMSTNVELCPDFTNPHIQAQLAERASVAITKAIATQFRRSRKNPSANTCAPTTAVPASLQIISLELARKGLLVTVGKDVSPQHLCVVATDSGEGSFHSKVMQDFLLEEGNLRQGVGECLDLLSEKAESVVSPMVGASKVDLKDGYLDDPKLRREHIRRLEAVLTELMSTFQCYVQRAGTKPRTLKEFAVIVWDDDIWRVMNDQDRTDWNKGLRNEVRRRSQHDPSGYVEMSTALTRVFDTSVEKIKDSKANCPGASK